MRIAVLAENEGRSPCEGEHGLSLWMERERGPLLMDMGASDMFLRNARRMGVEVERARAAVLSHGHYDHGGGLAAFLACNGSAPVFLSARAFEAHYSLRPSGEEAYIGLDPALRGHPRLRLVAGEGRIDDGALLFSGEENDALRARANDTLLQGEGAARQRDGFAHELNLLLTDGNKRVLVTGCAHRGIVGIVRRAVQLAGGPMDAVVGGFHLSNPRTGVCEPEETLRGVAAALGAWPTRYFTCHCTGRAAYERLARALGPRVRYLSAGEWIEL